MARREAASLGVLARATISGGTLLEAVSTISLHMHHRGSGTATPIGAKRAASSIDDVVDDDLLLLGEDEELLCSRVLTHFC